MENKIKGEKMRRCLSCGSSFVYERENNLIFCRKCGYDNIRKEDIPVKQEAVKMVKEHKYLVAVRQNEQVAVFEFESQSKANKFKKVAEENGFETITSPPGKKVKK